MNSVRRETIRSYLQEHRIVTMAQLGELLPDVSLMTLHRDLSFLQDRGLVEKVRGGARYVADDSMEAAFAAREIVNREAKAEIARKAVVLLGDAGSIFVDAGTTMMAFAQMMPDHKRNVVTTGPNIALELAKRHNLTISMCGGVLNKSNLTLSGTGAMEVLRTINIDTAFLVASGYSAKSGFTCGMESEATIKRMVIGKARRVVMLLDCSKMDRMLPYTFAQMEDLDYLVTEREPLALPEELRQHGGGIAFL